IKFCVTTVLFAAGALAADQPSPVTFYKDVLPILQMNCQTCHRPGQMGPMSLLTYESTRPWAKAIKEAVVIRKMPPWFANPDVGHFVKDRWLAQSDISVLGNWADSSAPKGDPKDAPPALEWAEGWHIKPDVIVKGPIFNVPAAPKSNVLEWITVTIPTGFTKD